MKNHRTLFSTLLVATAIATLVPQTVSYAKEINKGVDVVKEATNPSPRYAYTISTKLSLSVNASNASYSLTVIGISDVTSISGWVTLEKRNSSGNYYKVDSEYIDESTNELRINSNLSSDGSGKYRITFKGRVYTDNGSESLSVSKTTSY